RVFSCALCNLSSSQHPSYFFNAPRFIKPPDTDLRSPFQRLFLHHEMTVSEPRDLRLVRYAQHLIRLRELLQFDSDGFTNSPANPGINLVEHDRPRKLRSIRHRLQHEHQPRRLTT